MGRTEKEIQELLVNINKFSNEWTLENFGIPFIVPFEINKRIKKAFGRCIVEEVCSIRMRVKAMYLNYNCLKEASEEFIYSVVKHELIHYALFLQEKPYHDKDAYFQNTCHKLNVPLKITQEQFKAEMPQFYEVRINNKRRYEYKCNCQSHFSSRKYKRKYICTKCKADLVLCIQ